MKRLFFVLSSILIIVAIPVVTITSCTAIMVIKQGWDRERLEKQQIDESTKIWEQFWKEKEAQNKEMQPFYEAQQKELDARYEQERINQANFMQKVERANEATKTDKNPSVIPRPK